MIRKLRKVEAITEEGGEQPNQPPSPNAPRKQRLRLRDIENTLSAAKRAGLNITSVEIDPDGRVTVRFGERQIDPTEAELDEELRLWQLERDRKERAAAMKKRRE